MEKDETSSSSSSSINPGGSSSKWGKSVSSIDSSTRGQQPASSSVGDMSAKIDTVFDCVMPYIYDGNDRNSFSLVSRKWYELDSLTRKHVTVHMYYATTPSRLLQRFPFIESLTLKGGPLHFREKLNIDITPWIQQIAVSFICLKAVSLRSMIVSDSDIKLLVRSRGKELRVLKITRCKGFSTDGLLHIGKYCNDLRSFNLEDSRVRVKGVEWLHDLALGNSCIESLNFYDTRLGFDVEDLTLLAKNCSQSLVSLKLPDTIDMIDVTYFFKYAVKLEEFFRGEFNREGADEHVDFYFPPKLQCIALTVKREPVISDFLPFPHQLRELDVRFTHLYDHDIDDLVHRCPNLEVFYMVCFGDEGLQLIGQFCKRLRKFSANAGLVGLEPTPLSHSGLIALAQGCPELEYIDIELIDIANEALECIGAHLKNLRDIRITLKNEEGSITSLLLDNGVRALLIGCSKLERLDIRLWPGGLTDVGLGYIGKYGRSLRNMCLGYVGESDAGLVELSKGCPKLRKLELIGCPFSQQALAGLMSSITSLRYLSVHGDYYRDILFAMTRPVL